MGSTKDNVGKGLFVISSILGIYLLFSPVTGVLFHVDEYFTYSLLKLPLGDILTILINDVHPPLYYLILKFVLKTLTVLNIEFNLLYVLKMVSIIPYFLILAISGLKIRKEYNWLTAGLFAFTLMTMSEFFLDYLTIRMYSWAILFLLLSFIYLKEVMFVSDRKSWILFTIFTILGAYTHYFVALSLFLIYVMLFAYFLYKKDNVNLKKWGFSVIVSVISYIPWSFYLINQLKTVHNAYWIPPIDFNYFMSCITAIVSNNSDFLLDFHGTTVPQIISLFAVILLVFLVAWEFKSRRNSENYYMLVGIFLVIITIFLGVILSATFKPILRVRYLVPAIAVFWLAVSMLVGKLDNKKILTAVLSLILILGVFCFALSLNLSTDLVDNGVYEQNLFDSIQNDNDSIVIATDIGYYLFGTNINSSNVHTDLVEFLGVPNKHFHKLFNYTSDSRDDFKKIIHKNSNKTIYIIEPAFDKLEITDNSSFEVVHHVPNSFYDIYRN